MTRVFNIYFPNRTLILALTETTLIFAALLAATYAAFGTRTAIVLEYGNGFLRIALASAVCLLCMYYYDLYDSPVFTNPREVHTRLVQVLGTVCLILALLYYTYPSVGLDGRTFLVGVLMVGLLLAGWRRLFFVLNRSARLAEHALLLGDGPLAASVAREVGNHPELGLRLVGYLGPEEGGNFGKLRHLGAPGELRELVEPGGVNRIIVTMGDRRGNLPVETLLQLKSRGVLVQDGVELYEAVTGKVPVDALRLSWLLFSPGFRSSPGMLLYKRAASFVLSLVGLMLSLPLMAAAALAVWLDSGRPIIFRQKRLGKDGKPFTLYKFRSMHQDADADGRQRPVTEDDDRVTRVGKWLRRSRLDEIPQFYNILRGDMHFIGPRPFVPQQEEECRQQIPFYTQRWSVKPGATGWAQIHRGYCASLADNVEKLEYDLFYIKHQSVGLDLLIAFQTLKTLLLGRGGQ